MNIKIIKSLSSTLILLLLLCCSENNYIPLDKSNIQLVNREFIDSTNNGSNIISLNRENSSGLAIINNLDFESGVIELDILGEDNPGKSFVGFAFNIQNDSTYEAVYFRPFNFLSPEKIRREHCMQYIFHPDYPWYRLRREREGQFEAEFIDPPAPDNWFSVRIIIEPERVKVQDFLTQKILMDVERLSKSASSKIGFWTGYGSKGSFKKLRILHK